MREKDEGNEGVEQGRSSNIKKGGAAVLTWEKWGIF